MKLKIKERLKKNAMFMCSKNPKISGKECQTAFIFEAVSMSFYQESFNHINENEKWRKRLEKQHPYFKDSTKEMQSSNSSDALLMNVFCNPSISKNIGLIKLLHIQIDNASKDIIFGYKPGFSNESSSRQTEIDMKIGNHIFEAKLTESSFTKKAIDIVLKYPHINEIFDVNGLPINSDEEVLGYQLIRNICAAYKYNYDFTVLLDENRIDLIESFNKITQTIKIEHLKNRINYVSWQNIIHTLDGDFREYLAKKYL